MRRWVCQPRSYRVKRMSSTLSVRSFSDERIFSAHFMATLKPFAALLPKPELASQICELPYDVMSSDEARALAAGNPLSFLQDGFCPFLIFMPTLATMLAVYQHARRWSCLRCRELMFRISLNWIVSKKGRKAKSCGLSSSALNLQKEVLMSFATLEYLMCDALRRTA